MTTQMLNFIAITINVIVYVPYFIFVFLSFRAKIRFESIGIGNAYTNCLLIKGMNEYAPKKTY